jgi:hypothetical protein
MPIAAYGELIEALEAQRMALQALTRTIGQAMPDVAGRLRVAIDAISASLTLATITTVGTVTTVSTVTNQSQMGTIAANDQIPSLMKMSAHYKRKSQNTRLETMGVLHSCAYGYCCCIFYCVVKAL